MEVLHILIFFSSTNLSSKQIGAGLLGGFLGESCRACRILQRARGTLGGQTPLQFSFLNSFLSFYHFFFYCTYITFF